MAQRPAHVAFYRVDIGGGEGYTFPCLQLLNRRGGGAPVLLRWVYQRSLELLLFRRTDGGSTGAIWKLLNNTPPKWLVGFSDITALHSAFFTKFPADRFP